MKTTKDILEMICEYHEKQVKRKANMVLREMQIYSIYGYVDTDMKVTVKRTILTSIIMCSIASIYVEGGDF